MFAELVLEETEASPSLNAPVQKLVTRSDAPMRMERPLPANPVKKSIGVQPPLPQE